MPLEDFLTLYIWRTWNEEGRWRTWNEEEGGYASRFYRSFLESIKSYLLILVAVPGLIDALAQLLAWRSLLWLSMMWRQRHLTQSNFLSTTSLTDLWHYLYCFLSQENPLRWKEIHTHTYEVNKQTHFSQYIQKQPAEKILFSFFRDLQDFKIVIFVNFKLVSIN